MQSGVYQELQNFVNKFYDPSRTGYRQMSELVASKVNSIDTESDWSRLIGFMRSDYGDVEDLAFMQFPNRELRIVDYELVEGYRVSKLFTVCLSLLCPFYTLFYDYAFAIQAPTGHYVDISRICFLKDEKFGMISRNLDISNIMKIVGTLFPDYRYVDHYPLMTWSAESGPPFGAFESATTKYTFYQYLFDRYQPEKVYM